MKIRIGYLDETLGVIENTPDGLRYSGDVTELTALVTEFTQDSTLTGAPLLQALRRALNGYWWTQDVADDLRDKEQFTSR